MYGTKLITWQKKNGDIVQRKVQGHYRVGEKNCYNWEIIDIKYWGWNKFLSKKEYDKYLKIDSYLEQLNFKLKSYSKKILHYATFLILIRFVAILDVIV